MPIPSPYVHEPHTGLRQTVGLVVRLHTHSSSCPTSFEVGGRTQIQVWKHGRQHTPAETQKRAGTAGRSDTSEIITLMELAHLPVSCSTRLPLQLPPPSSVTPPAHCGTSSSCLIASPRARCLTDPAGETGEHLQVDTHSLVTKNQKSGSRQQVTFVPQQVRLEVAPRSSSTSCSCSVPGSSLPGR